MRTYRNYRGVKIFRHKNMICGSDFKINAAGSSVPSKPKFNITYSYQDGYPCDTLDEVESDIDDLIKQALDRGDIAEKDMVDILNQPA